MPETKTIDDGFFGELVVHHGYATRAQVEECLRLKRDEEERGNRRQVGELMVERGYLLTNQVQEVLRLQQKTIMRCPACDKMFNVAGQTEGRLVACPTCGGSLEPSNDPDAIATEFVRVTADPAFRTLDPDSLAGVNLAGCRVLQKIAIGGMGTIYRAEQINMKRPVALKVLSDDLARDKAYIQRFIREARAAGELNHTNLIHVNDVGYAEGIFYYVMEFVDGRSLDDILEERKHLTVPEAVRITIETARALEHAHSRGIIHRDIKPDNLMITREGGVKLADLGIVKRVAADGMHMTEAGMVLGTPHYMAPEQGRDSRFADARSDIYALGSSLYHMLSGRVPFDGKTSMDVLVKLVETDPAPLRELDPGLPDGIVRIVEKMMKKDPNLRYASATALLKDLEYFRSTGKTPPALAPAPAAAGDSTTARRAPHRVPTPATPKAPAPMPPAEVAKRASPTPKAAPAPASPPAPASGGRDASGPRPAVRKAPKKEAAADFMPVGNPFVRDEQKASKWPAAAMLIGAVIVLIIGVKVVRNMTADDGGIVSPPPGTGGSGSGGSAFYGGSTTSSTSSTTTVTGTAVRFDNPEAQQYLDQADTFVKEHPDEMEQARTEFARIASIYEGTKQGNLAKERVKVIDDGRRKALEAELAEVDKEIEAAKTSGVFGAAHEHLRKIRNRYPEESAKEPIGGREKTCLAEAQRRFDAGMEEVEKQAAAHAFAAAATVLDGIDRIGIPELALKADRRRAELVQTWRDEEAKASANYSASYDHVQAFCDAGEYEKAENMLVELAALPDLTVILPSISADLDAIRRTRALLEARVAGLQRLAKDGTPHEFERLGKDGKATMTTGTVGAIRKDQFMLKVGSGSTTIKLDTLSPAENVRLARLEWGDTAEADLHAAAYATVRRDFDGAEAACLAAGAKGTAVEAALDRLDLRRISTRETGWETWWTYRLGGWEAKSGKWEEADGSFTGGEDTGTYAARKALDGAYRLRIVARKQAGMNGFLIGFSAFGKKLIWAIGDGGNKQSLVRGVESSQNACALSAGTWHTVEIAVLEDRAIAWLDGKRMWRLVPEQVLPAVEGVADLSVGVVSTKVTFREVSVNKLK